MGARWTAWTAAAAIGCKIERSKLFKVERARVCQHGLVDATSKFCDICGKPAWKMDEQPIDGMVYDEMKGEWNLHRMAVLCSTDDRQMVVCSVMTPRADGQYQVQFLPPTKYDITKDDMRKILEPHGLWNEAAFGMYVVMHCSY